MIKNDGSNERYLLFFVIIIKMFDVRVHDIIEQKFFCDLIVRVLMINNFSLSRISLIKLRARRYKIYLY